jgi:hypothetical protein
VDWHSGWNEVGKNQQVMKKAFFHLSAACCALLCASAALAQGPVFGVKAGLNYTNLAGIDADDNNARVGFNAGVFGRTDPEQSVGLQAELLYSAKGNHTKYNTFFGLIDQDVDFNLNYLELPVLASLRLADIVDIQLGGYAAYLLSAKVSTSGDLGSGDDELDKDDFKSIDAGIAGGVAFNLGSNAQIGIRYLHGLTNVVDDPDLQDFIGDAQNRCLQVYLGIGVGN